VTLTVEVILVSIFDCDDVTDDPRKQIIINLTRDQDAPGKKSNN
jgi:hypothetical protein